MFPDACQWPPYILVAMIVAGAAFFVALWPKLRVLMQSAGENRLDRPVQRLWNTLCIAFAQSKMFKDSRAGWMHALIFWGFLILLVRAVQFFIIGIYPSLLYPSYYSYSSIWIGYSFAKDCVVLLVSLACCYALFRRLVTKPKRLNLSGEAILILALSWP